MSPCYIILSANLTGNKMADENTHIYSAFWWSTSRVCRGGGGLKVEGEGSMLRVFRYRRDVQIRWSIDLQKANMSRQIFSEGFFKTANMSLQENPASWVRLGEVWLLYSELAGS